MSLKGIYPYLQKLADIIEWPCFESNKNTCKRNEGIAITALHYHKMACCNGCMAYRGYLYDDFENVVKKYKFDNKTSFWREGKGCILPRRTRSWVCLLYYCNPHQLDIATESYVSFLHKVRRDVFEPAQSRMRGF